MNTQTIDCILRRIFRNRNVFTGVYSSDMIPTIKPNEPFCFVCNIDPSSKPGSHWVAYVRCGSSNKIEFFDSYGLPYFFYSLSLHADLNSSIILQSPFSRVCGHYCIMYIYYRFYRKLSISETIKCLASASTPSLRDKHVRIQVSKLIRTLPSCGEKHYFVCCNSNSNQCCCSKCESK